MGRLVPWEYHDAVLGDLEEEFRDRWGQDGRAGPARLWYWRQVVTVDVLRLRAEARAERARRGEGGVTVDAFWMDLRQAGRAFRHNPGFSLAVLLTLAIGIGGATSIFSLVNGLLLRPIPGVEAPSSLAAVQASESGGGFGVASYMDYLDLSDRSRAVERMAAFKPRRVDAAAAGAPEPLEAALVTSSYFDVLGVTPFMGRFFAEEVDRGPGAHPQVVLTHGLWQRWFASEPEIEGAEIVLNGRSYTVVGVTPPGFRGSTLVEVPELFVPMTMQPDLMPGNGLLLDRRGWGGVAVVGRLTEGFTLPAAAAEMAALGEQLEGAYPTTNRGRAYTAVAFRDAALPGEARRPLVQTSSLLLAVVGALWLVVCLNVANLFLARAIKRRREVAVRLAMGAGRGRIAKRLLVEFVLIAVAAGVAGLGLSRLVGAALATLPLPLVVDTDLDGRTMVVAAALVVASIALCALAPALALSGADPRTVAAPAGALRPVRHRWPSRVLVVGQVTVSVVLLFATGLFVRTFANLSSAERGLVASGILTARFDPSLQGYDATRIAQFYDELSEAAGTLPGVTAVALSDALPSAGSFGSDGWFFPNATEPERSSSMSSSAVSPNFFQMMGIPIVAGRGFTEDDAPGRAPVILVNEVGARLVEARTGSPAIGQGIGMNGPGGPFFTIVGVVGDSRTGRMQQAVPMVYGSHGQLLASGAGGQRMVVLLKASVPPATLADELRLAAASVDPNVSAADVITLERFLDDLLVADRLTVTVLGVSSLVALLLVAIGLYGLLAYLVTLRTKEFGVRLALGAPRTNLKAIVLREAMALAAVGLGLGMGVALALTRLLERFLVGVSAADPVSMLASLGAVVGVALCAAYIPSARAMRSDPLVAMRAE
jgi:predicted permease